MRCWLGCLIFAACAPQRDPVSSDASPDTLDPRRGDVLVHVLDPYGAGGHAGVRVVISDPDGALYQTVTTDGAGVAVGKILPGGSITALDLVRYTVLDVMPGDEITVGANPTPLQLAAGTLDVTFSPLSGAFSYKLYTSCGMKDFITGPQVRIVLNAPCDVVSALILARDTSGQVIGAVWTEEMPFVNGGAVAMPATWTSMGQFSAMITNLPSGLHYVDVTRRVPEAFEAALTTASAMMPAPGALVLSQVLIPGPSAEVAIVFDDGVDSKSQRYFERIDATATSLQLDAATALLPWIGPVTFDPSTASMHETGSNGLAPTIVQTRISWTPVGELQQDWMIYGPSLTDFVLPQLLPGYGPGANDHGVLFMTAAYSDAYGGYAEARTRPTQAISDGYGRAAFGNIGEAGTRWQVSDAVAGF
jgi:hypothetical protein